MSMSLPTASELAKLPLRAVLAYSARNAQRISEQLTGVIPSEILKRMVDALDCSWKVDVLSSADAATAVAASADVMAAYEAVPPNSKSAARTRLVLFFVDASLAVVTAMKAMKKPGGMCRDAELVRQKVAQATDRIRFANGQAAYDLARSARRDYDMLVRAHGNNDDGCMKGAIDCFGN